MPDVVIEQRDGGVLWCTFDRSPKINASSPEMIGHWYEALVEAKDDPSVHVVVTANTGRAWCAGADMDLLLRHQSRANDDHFRLNDLAWELLHDEERDAPDADWDRIGLNHLAAFLVDYPKPLLAAIDGAVAGGGVPLALLHDVRFVTPSSTFRTSFTGLGLVSELGLSYLLPRMVGLGRALDISLSGRAIDAEESVQIGMAERMVDSAEELDVVVAAYARALVGIPAGSLRSVRSLIRVASAMPWDTYLATEWAKQCRAHASPEASAGVIAVARRLGYDISDQNEEQA